MDGLDAEPEIKVNNKMEKPCFMSGGGAMPIWCEDSS